MKEEEIFLSPAAKALIEGKASELNFEQLASAIPQILFIPLPDQLSLSDISEAVLATFDPTKSSTQAHHLLYNLAQLEIERGNFASAFQIQSKVVPLASSHPLYNMEQAIQEGSARQIDPKTGAYFSNLDSSIVKGGNLHATQRTIDGQQLNCFDFKIAHHARNELSRQLEGIVHNLDAFKASLPPDFCRDVKIQEAAQEYVRYDSKTDQFTHEGAYRPLKAKAMEIVFEGVGKVIVGKSKRCGCMYNWVQVEMEPHLPPGEGLQKLQRMLSMMGLGPVLGAQPEESQERMKIAQLYRAFYSADATAMCQEKPFFEMDLEQLKETIIAQHPKMEEIFETYLDSMERIEILRGKEIWGVPDLGEKMAEKGVWGVMVGLGHSETSPKIAQWNKTKETIYKRLTEGFLSSEQRFQQGEFSAGVSSEEDLGAGGGDQVYTRVVNDTLKEKGIYNYPFSGVAQILLDLKKVARRVPYGYPSDEFGVKNPHHPEYSTYQTRQSPTEFAATVAGENNEMMLKNAVSPDHIVGIVVDSHWKRQDLIQFLEKRGVAKRERDTVLIFGRPAQEFIHVRSGRQPFKRAMWQKAA